MVFGVAACVSVCAAIACSDPPAPSLAPTPPPTTVAPAAEIEAAPSAPARVRYDLAAHLARAELRDGDTLVVDFGTPGAAKYTLGGWRTRVGRDAMDGDASVSVIENVTGFVLAPSDR